ncbi:3-isopropylmalate dehydratase small subunit [Phenylobacterium sp.]|uniref:3-isopropylmalate dehydratase small subunit n=1 Tax=Phenylobacterium sp. TaxID=1871053 RepID=UPI002FC811E3
MEPFTVVEGLAAPFPAANIDTDVIMPKRFLKGVDREGLADGVFADLRFDASGRPDEGFILNREGWRGAAFLVVGPNFGCGSSREHAVWGLRQLGVRALIGASYAGIFFDNCARNGLLAVSMDPARIERLMAAASNPSRNAARIDLDAQTVSMGGCSVRFEIDGYLKDMLREGLDPVGATLKGRDRISAFEANHFDAFPWLRSHLAAHAHARVA